MIVDTSAIMAIVFEEPEADALISVLSSGSDAAIGAPTLVEAGIVLGCRLGFDKRGLLPRFLQEFGIAEIPFGEVHWKAAVDAYERFGRGRHRAALSYGDCLSYATAKLASRPLLCVGEDFRHTDLDLVPLV